VVEESPKSFDLINNNNNTRGNIVRSVVVLGQTRLKTVQDDTKKPLTEEKSPSFFILVP